MWHFFADLIIAAPCYAERFFLALYRGAGAVPLCCMNSEIRKVFSVHLYHRAARKRVVSQAFSVAISIWCAVLNRSLFTWWRESPLWLRCLVNGSAQWQSSLVKKADQFSFSGVTIHWHHMKLKRHFKYYEYIGHFNGGYSIKKNLHWDWSHGKMSLGHSPGRQWGLLWCYL